MSTPFLEAIKVRRTNYALSRQCPISDEKLKDIVETAVLHCPTAFNTQTSRAVIVTGKSHEKVWEICKREYIKTVGDDKAQVEFVEKKIDQEYAAGYGTVIFFEDTAIIEAMAARMPPLAHCFPVWSDNSTGMLQFVVWTALTNEGLGASLQHYGAYSPDITPGILNEFGLSSTWKCTALIPFGLPIGPPGRADRPKTFEPIEKRVLTFN